MKGRGAVMIAWAFCVCVCAAFWYGVVHYSGLLFVAKPAAIAAPAPVGIDFVAAAKRINAPFIGPGLEHPVKLAACSWLRITPKQPLAVLQLSGQLTVMIMRPDDSTVVCETEAPR